MSWNNIRISDVNPNQLDLVAAGKYVFTINPGTKYNERGAVLFSATIESDGEFKGKRMLASYPDPESTTAEGKPQTWSAVAFKRLEIAVGHDVQEGEDPVTYLNRVAGSKFTAGVTVREDQTGQKRSNIQLLNVTPAA